MKKFISVALCAAMLLSMAVMPASAARVVKAPTSSTQSSTTTKRKVIKKEDANKKKSSKKDTDSVTQPNVPEFMSDEYFTYLREHQTPEAFLESMQKFSAKTAPTLLSQKAENQAYSPISFAYAMGLLGSGAKGTIDNKIAEFLECDDMETAIDGLKKFYEANYRSEDSNTLQFANSIWMQKDYPFVSSFSKNAAEKLYASAHAVDFGNDAGQQMSKWISEHTGGLLNPLIDTTPAQILALINTVYFKGSWRNEFNTALNTVEKFHLEDGTDIDTTYMNQHFEDHSYYQNDDYTMMSLPFAGGQKMSFVLPKEGSDLSSLLNDETMAKILAKQPNETARLAAINLKLPKFDFDTKLNLVDICKQLGLEELFDGTANLSGISKGDILVSDIEQGSHVEIDEKGCKAAAYTIIAIECTSMAEPLEPYDFSLDRPFLFVIQSADNAPLFIGTVYNPEGTVEYLPE